MPEYSWVHWEKGVESENSMIYPFLETKLDFKILLDPDLQENTASLLKFAANKMSLWFLIK